MYYKVLILPVEVLKMRRFYRVSEKCFKRDVPFFQAFGKKGREILSPFQNYSLREELSNDVLGDSVSQLVAKGLDQVKALPQDFNLLDSSLKVGAPLHSAAVFSEQVCLHTYSQNYTARDERMFNIKMDIKKNATNLSYKFWGGV